MTEQTKLDYQSGIEQQLLWPFTFEKQACDTNMLIAWLYLSLCCLMTYYWRTSTIGMGASLSTQNTLDQSAAWTKENQMKLNEFKSKYMVFTHSNNEFSTRLLLIGNTFDRKHICTGQEHS